MDYLKCEVDFSKALKGSLVEEKLNAAAKAGHVPAKTFERTVERLKVWCAQNGVKTVRDVENLPGNMGQLGFAGYGADIYLIVAEVARYYRDKPESEDKPAEQPVVSRQKSDKAPDSKADKK